MRHLAFIIDGNGRWAEHRGKPRTEGYAAGAEALLRAIDAVEKTQIEFVTFYSFSQENLSRNENEVKIIFNVIESYLKAHILPIAIERNYRIRFIGELNLMPENLLLTVNELNSITLNNTGKTLNFAICYGGDMEIAYAFNRLIKLVSESGKVTPSDIREHLYTSNMPDPDAIIRYGGHKRLSNFMPMQSAYSELFFLDKFWPDFDESDLHKIIGEYESIKRNFGGDR